MTEKSSHYAVITPITLRLQKQHDEGFHPPTHYSGGYPSAILPKHASPPNIQYRHRQQLQYEPDSAKCFIYRTQMHLQGYSTQPHNAASLAYGNPGYLPSPRKSSSTLPLIGSKFSIEVDTERRKSLSSLEAVTGTSKEIIPQPIVSVSFPSHKRTNSLKNKDNLGTSRQRKDRKKPVSRNPASHQVPIDGLTSLDSTEEQTSFQPVSLQQRMSITSSVVSQQTDAIASSLLSHQVETLSLASSTESEQNEADSSMVDHNNNNRMPYSIELKITRAKCSKNKTKRRKTKPRGCKLFNHRLKTIQKSYEPSNLSSEPQNKCHLNRTTTHLQQEYKPLVPFSAQIKSRNLVEKHLQTKSAGYEDQRLCSNRNTIVFNGRAGMASSVSAHFTFSTQKPVLLRPPVQQAFLTSPPAVVTATPNQQPAATESPQKQQLLRSSQQQQLRVHNPEHPHQGLLSPKSTETVYQEPRKLTKVYQSEAQSGVLQTSGVDIPRAPPATPAPEMLEKYEYVPSMGDVRSQRAVRARLELMERHEQKVREAKQRQREQREKQNELLRVKQTKTRQRKEIYALNRLMTELENRNFVDFCRSKGIDLDV